MDTHEERSEQRGHSHTHEHGHGHSHTHEHDHDHSHEHEHSHDHGRKGWFKRGHGHSHGHDHGHGHGPGHGHAHEHDLRGVSKRKLWVAFWLISGFMVAEVVGGILSGSLALLADAGHMVTDAASIGLAIFAMRMAERPASIERTFGHHRTEILAAMINALSLWLIAGLVISEAYERFFDVPEVEGGLMLTVGAIGLAVNIAAAWVLHSHAEHSMNVEGAFQHVLADLYGSVGVIVSGILIRTLDWNISDPILSVVLGLLIFYNSLGLVRKVFHVLMEGTPHHLDVYKLCHDIESLEGVTVIHDVHAWSVSSEEELLTAHVLIDPDWGGDLKEMLEEIRRIAYEDHKLTHVTIQLETSARECKERHHVGHLEARSRIRA